MFIKRFAVFYRLLLAGVTLAAIITQFVVGAREVGFRPSNFLSFFTILSNIFALVLFLYGAARLARNKPASRRYELIRCAGTLYMAVTGLVVLLILSKYQELLQLTLPWVDTQLHDIMPVALALDWLLLPPAFAIRAKQAVWWLAFPIVYVVYSLIRGPIVHWYPYPFLDPAKVGGYGGVALYCVGILLGMCITGAVILWTGNARAPAQKPAAKKKTAKQHP